MENVIKHTDPFFGEVELKKVDEINSSMMGYYRSDGLYVFETANGNKTYFIKTVADIGQPTIEPIDKPFIDLILKNCK